MNRKGRKQLEFPKLNILKMNRAFDIKNFDLEDDDKKKVDFKGETITFTNFFMKA